MRARPRPAPPPCRARTVAIRDARRIAAGDGMSTVLPSVRPRRHLFVFGHMRSYSSLLCHILGSHPEIDGYCETHIKYRWYFDLLRLRYRVVTLTGEPLRGRY